jgi:putative DNA primase/helicase
MIHDMSAAARAENGSARLSLTDHGIWLRDHRQGEHRTACPECAKAKRRSSDTALAVRVDPDGDAVWICHRCGWAGGIRPLGDRHGWRHRQPAEQLSPPPSTRHPGLSAYAKRLWYGCRPITPGTPAAAYLEGRGCALPENDVRWHPQLRHPSGYVGPALVALVTDVLTVEPISLHQTWLAPDGSGKASIDRPRLLLKGHRKAGGIIRLVEDAEVTLGLAIAEGLETALTTMRAFRSTWACIDAGNLAAFPVLSGIEALTIVEDHDPAGRAAARACADRWLAAGAEVWIWHAPTEGEDLNDVARRMAS